MTPQKEKLVSNWCQNRKNHNFKRNKILQTIDFKGFAKKSQKISTHLLTVLTTSVILQLEQRKRDTKREKEEKTSGIRTPESSKETGKQKRFGKKMSRRKRSDDLC